MKKQELYNNIPLWFLVIVLGMSSLVFHDFFLRGVTLFLAICYAYNIGVDDCKFDFRVGEFKKRRVGVKQK